MKDVIFRGLCETDIPSLKNFAPAEWNFDLEEFLLRVNCKPVFEAIVAEKDNGIITGFGHLLQSGSNCWLGNIIVSPESQGMGYGTALTQILIDKCRKSGARTISLIATAQGEKIYSRLGFVTECFYHCYTPPAGNPDHEITDGTIRILDSGSFGQVCDLDRIATGEDRSMLLADHIKSGYASFDGNVMLGFFLPSWDNGPVISSQHDTGLALLDFKMRYFNLPLVLPETNYRTIDYLEKRGFTLKWRLPRMVMGSTHNWNPEMIFSRAAGYCG